MPFTASIHAVDPVDDFREFDDVFVEFPPDDHVVASSIMNWLDRLATPIAADVSSRTTEL